MPAENDTPNPLMRDLMPLVYDELRKAAEHYFRRQPQGFTLRPTELVNEACLHLLKHGQDQWHSHEHFRAIATHKIWQVVVDHLKRRQALKRGGRPRSTTGGGPGRPAGPIRVPIDSVPVEWRDRTIDLLDLAQALDDLGGESKRLREVVMLHWFGGMNYSDVARLLGVSSSTVEKDFRYALAWLHRRLAERDADAE